MTDRRQQDHGRPDGIFYRVRRLPQLTKLDCSQARLSPEIRYCKTLIRAANRDNFRDTVLRCITPFVVARCNSGWATWNADCAAALSPLAIAVSTFFTKVRMRLSRALLVAVRVSVCRRRFSADL